ncbi:MAG: ATP-binding protein [Myxococcota bacterium]
MRELAEAPGNARIAAALLDVLSASGSASLRARAEKALEGGGPPRGRRSGWIAIEHLRDGFRAAAVDPPLARRIGRALVAPRAIGLLLSYAGIATPEKAYRRCDRLLPREQRGDRFTPAHLEQGRALIEFQPETPSPADALFCSVRLGMLEAMTPLYGLLPARVTETSCAHRGASACVYEVAWKGTPRTGLLLGTLVGALLGAAAAAGLTSLGSLAGSVAAAIALLASLTGAAVGRSIDLSRQLDAVARGGLGRLTLPEQVDGVLAEKMDALAKLDATGPEPAPVRALGSSPLRSGPNESLAPNLARRLHRSVAALQHSLDALREHDLDSDDARSFLDECAEVAREIHGIGAEVAAGEGEGTPALETADLAQVVRQGVAAVSIRQPTSIEVALEITVESALVRCQPFQLEQVVTGLIVNACQAMAGQGTVAVALRECPEGYEVAISDDGEGIDPEILDRLFDPFFTPPAGDDTELSLAFCYRTVNQHGGELLVHSEPGHGTRVAVVLPAAS